MYKTYKNKATPTNIPSLFKVKNYLKGEGGGIPSTPGVKTTPLHPKCQNNNYNINNNQMKMS